MNKFLLILLLTTEAFTPMKGSPVIDKGTTQVVGIVNKDFFGVPTTGKWPGDKPDIGAIEWVPEEIGRDYFINGGTLDYNPTINPVINLHIDSTDK